MSVKVIVRVVPGEERETTVEDPDKLLDASWWFRVMLTGPYREAQVGIVRIEAADVNEMDLLLHLVEVEGKGGTIWYPLALSELVELYLVAHKYGFEEVVVGCRMDILEAADMEDRDALAGVLAAIPEAMYSDPEVQRVLHRVAKRFFANFGEHENFMWDLGQWQCSSIAKVKPAELATSWPAVQILPPHALALVIRMRHSVENYNEAMDSGIYRVMQSYLAQYPQGNGDDQVAAALDAYRVLVEAFLNPRCALSRDFVCFVVTTCPYAQPSGLLPQIVAGGLALRLSPLSLASYRLTKRIQVDSSIRDFEPGDRMYSYMGMHRGLDMFLCVTRARVPAHEDVFAMILVARCPGRPPKKKGPFVTDTIYDVSGYEGECTCRASALVCFEGDKISAVQSLGLLQECMVNESMALSSTATWVEAVAEMGTYFDEERTITLK